MRQIEPLFDHFIGPADKRQRHGEAERLIEEQAAKAHLATQLLGQARAELGIVTGRGNAGGVRAVTWSLPAP
jgi:hypothetical protein